MSFIEFHQLIFHLSGCSFDPPKQCKVFMSVPEATFDVPKSVAVASAQVCSRFSVTFPFSGEKSNCYISLSVFENCFYHGFTVYNGFPMHNVFFSTFDVERPQFYEATKVDTDFYFINFLRETLLILCGHCLITIKYIPYEMLVLSIANNLHKLAINHSSHSLKPL